MCSQSKRLLRNTWLEIDLDRLARNVAALRAHVGPGVKLAPVIKADAYGHGAVAIARELGAMGAAYLCVAMLPEALELRNNGIRTPVLVMGYTGDNCLGIAVKNDVTVTIFDYDQAVLLSREAERLDMAAAAHVKVDTGFHRLGKEPGAEFAREILRMDALPNLSIKGMFTHLRLADREGDEKQYKSFAAFAKELRGKGLHLDCCHISDSIAAVKYPRFAMDMIRPGAIVYGYLPKDQAGQIAVEPVSAFKTTITSVRKVAGGEGVGYGEDYVAADGTVVATLAAGYADGYPRHLSRKGEVLIGNSRARVIGAVCMDQMMVDVTHIPGVKVGDEAVLFGPGEGAPSLEELSELADSNKNSIMSGISRRVPRVYMKNGSVAGIVDYLAPE